MLPSFLTCLLINLFILVAFGFCEYSDPEATLRALRLLHNFKLGDKTLVVRIIGCDRFFSYLIVLQVKVDSKTRKELVEYIAKKKLVKTGASEEEVINTLN